MCVNFLVADPHREKNVSATHDGLIGVIGIQPKPPARECSCKDIAGGGNALTGCATDGKREIELP